MKRIVICLVLLIFVLLAAFLLSSARQDKVAEKDNNLTIDISKFNLENRVKLFVNEELLIGGNIKELENGYYDFKLSNKDRAVVITLNKLWYEEYGLNYIQDEYLAQICREIVKCIEITCEKEDLEYQLYKYIKDNYLKVKEGQDIEKIEIDGLDIWAKSINSECAIYLKVE